MGTTLPFTIYNDNPTSIQNLIDNYIQTEEILKYDCSEKGANSSNSCQGKERTQTQDIILVSDYLIIQLNIFKFDSYTGPFKLQPKIEINQHISIAETNMDLFGIVFHRGTSVNAGHYTSAVLAANSWFMTNDEYISQWIPKYFYDKTCIDFPYFAIYKKSANQNLSMNVPASVSLMPESTLYTPPKPKRTTYADVVCSNVEKKTNTNTIKMPPLVNYISIVEDCVDDSICYDTSKSDKAYSNLCQAVVNDLECESSETLKLAKSNVIK